MNCTNQNTTSAANAITTPGQVPPFKARCNRMGIHVPGDAPSPAEIIPYIEKRLAAHMNHVSRAMNPWTADNIYWKQLHDAYHEFLTDLRVAQAHQSAEKLAAVAPRGPLTLSPIPPISSQNKKSTAQPAQKTSTPSTTTNSNPDATRTQPGRNPDDPGQGRTLPGPNTDHPGQSRTQPGQPPSSSDRDEDEPPKIDSTDEELVEAVAHLHYRRKGRSPFDKLTPEQQALIVEMMDVFTSKSVRETIAQPPPIGFNFKIGKSAICEFVKRYNKREADQRLHEAARASIELLNKSSEPNQTFAQTFERMLQIKALTMASDPRTSLSTFDALATTINKLRKQSLAERKQLHAEKPK